MRKLTEFSKSNEGRGGMEAEFLPLSDSNVWVSLTADTTKRVAKPAGAKYAVLNLGSPFFVYEGDSDDDLAIPTSDVLTPVAQLPVRDVTKIRLDSSKTHLILRSAGTQTGNIRFYS